MIAACARLGGGLLLAATAAPAMAQEAEDAAEQEDDYASAGAVEVGGGVGASWTPERLEVRASPSVGFFVADGVELSGLLQLNHVWEEAGDASRIGATAVELVLEPSYHAHVGEDLLLFGGLGVGVAYDRDGLAPEVVPRVGLNVPVGESAVLTTALRAPVLLGAGRGEGPGFGASVGVGGEMGITTTW